MTHHIGCECDDCDALLDAMTVDQLQAIAAELREQHAELLAEQAELIAEAARLRRESACVGRQMVRRAYHA